MPESNPATEDAPPIPEFAKPEPKSKKQEANPLKAATTGDESSDSDSDSDDEVKGSLDKEESADIAEMKHAMKDLKKVKDDAKPDESVKKDI